MIKMTSSFTKCFLFFLSPFLSLPFLIEGIYRKERISIILFIAVLSVISYLYIPFITNDKTSYYLLYQEVANMPFKTFWSFLVHQRTDSIFYLSIYIFRFLNIPLSYMFLIMTFFTIFFLYDLYFKVIDKYSINGCNLFFVFFLLIFFSLSPSGLFSGVRFYMAIAITIYGLGNIVLFDKKYLGIFFVCIGALIHYSCLLYIPVVILLYLTKSKHRLFPFLLLFSFSFYFLPRNWLLEHIYIIDYSESFDIKINAYLGEYDYIENGMQQGSGTYLKFFWKYIWQFIAYIYLIKFRKNQSALKNGFLLSLSIANVFFSAPTVYHRYILISLGLFILLLIQDYYIGFKNKKYIYILLIILGLNFWGNIYIMRQNFYKSLIDFHSLTLPTILLKEQLDYNEIVEN